MEAYRYILDVDDKGRLENVELPEFSKSKVEVIILPLNNDSEIDLVKASKSSMNFWDNKVDDETWNNI